MTSVPSTVGEWDSRNSHRPLCQQHSYRHANMTTYGFQEEQNWRVRSRSRAFIDTSNEMSSVKEETEMSPRTMNNFALSSTRDGSPGMDPMMGGDVVSPSHVISQLPPAAWFSSESSCSTCHLAQELTATQQLQNEALVKSLSRILSKLGRMSQFVGDLERSTAKLENVESPKSSSTSQRDVDGEDPPDFAVGMYPTSKGSATISAIVAELSNAVSEVKEICLNSANLCFANLSSPSAGFIAKHSSGTKSRLKRGNTITTLPQSSISTTRRTCSTMQGYGLEPGAIMQQRISPSMSINCNPPLKYMQMQSVLEGKDEWVESLRRTHSESELSSSHVEVCMGLDESLRLDSSVKASRDGTEPQTPTNRLMRQDPFQSYFMTMWQWQNKIRMNSITSMRSMVTSPLEPPGDTDSFVTPLGEGLSADSKQMLEKIAHLESERMTLLDELNEARKENFKVWNSLDDVVMDLNAKEIHLDLLKRDLQLATSEIRSSTEMRQEIESLRKDHDLMLERLTKSQDESHTLKESLVHLLQEKSQINQQLTLENQSLRAKIAQYRSSAGLSHQTSVGEREIEEGKLEPMTLDNQVQCVYMQGFLIKQGHRVKSWKKRLFVLDNENLTYYKAEQPQGCLSLSDVVKAQVSQLGTHPNMFQVHTRNNGRDQGRTYFLSANSHEEMQSWVGMLQALKHTRSHASTTAAAFSVAHSDSKQSGTTADPAHQKAKGRSRTAFDSATSTITLPPRLDPPLSPVRKDVQSAYMPSSRTRMLSETNNPHGIRNRSPFDTTDEEDCDTGNRSPFSGLSSDEESRTSNTEGFKLKHFSKH